MQRWPVSKGDFTVIEGSEEALDDIFSLSAVMNFYHKSTFHIRVSDTNYLNRRRLTTL